MKRVISIIVVIILLGFVYVYFFMYNKSHPNYSKMDAEYSLSAKILYNNFTTNNDSKKYLGKIVMIDGIVSDVEKNDSTSIIIFNFEEGMFGDQGVRCSMTNFDIHIRFGDSINIKGLCVGYNDTDVLLEYCSFVEPYNLNK